MCYSAHRDTPYEHTICTYCGAQIETYPLPEAPHVVYKGETYCKKCDDEYHGHEHYIVGGQCVRCFMHWDDCFPGQCDGIIGP